jgi:hypothetical protein
MYTVFELYSSFNILSLLPPLLTGINPLRQDLFCPPILQFCKRKKKNDIFACLRQLHIVSLWHFYECMYYNPVWFISSISGHWWLMLVILATWEAEIRRTVV